MKVFRMILNISVFFMAGAIVACGGGSSGGGSVKVPVKPLWVKQVGVAGVNTEGLSVTVDANLNVYMMGTTTGNLDGARVGVQDFYISKYNSSGTKLWTKQFGVSGESAHPFSWSKTIAVDSGSNVYITGNIGSFDPDIDAIVIKYNSNGVQQWVRRIGTAGTQTLGQSIVVDASSNLYVAGYTSGNLDGVVTGHQDLFIAKYDSNGSQQWIKQVGVAAAYIELYSIAVDRDSNIYATGFTDAALGDASYSSKDSFLIKYDSNGVQQWTEQWGVAGASTEALDITIDKDLGVYVTGATSGNLDGSVSENSAVFIVKYDTAGIRQWVRQFSASGASVAGYSIIHDASSNVYITGYTTGSIGDNHLVGTTDAFILKYDSKGVQQLTMQLGAKGAETWGTSIAVDANFNIYITGGTDGDLSENGSIGSQDAFLIKF